jgi:hypothetical protein
MKNGDVLSGRIISFYDGICIFDTHYGTAINLQTTQVHALETDARYNVTFTSGEQAVGRLIKGAVGGTQLQSTAFGTVSVEVSTIVRLVKLLPNEPRQASAPDAIADSYGQNNDDAPPLDFLTGSTVLLAPGRYELDLGLRYKQSRTQYGLFEAGYFQRSSYSARQLELETSLRAGLFTGVEGYLSVPVTYSHVEDVSTNEYVRSAQAWNMADVRFGGQYQLLNETAQWPALSLTLDMSAPTGNKRYRDPSNTWKDPLDNGSGHWSVAPGLAFVRSTDPAILFGGVNYRHAFADTLDGYRVQPGWVLASYFGVGFALNEKLSLGTRLSYAYSANLKVEGETIRGSDGDPMDITFSVSYRVADNWVVSPLLSIGLNDDAGPAALSMNLKRRLH